MANLITAGYKDNLLGEVSSFLKVLEQVSRLAPLNKPVFIINERGTDKGLTASRLHYLSSRWRGPFTSLSCATLNGNLLDSELLGHEAGAFTGAQKRHPGKLERTSGGTLFLDGLVMAPMMVQEKLLCVIEYGELEHVGSSQPLQVDVWLACVTDTDLPVMVNEGTFQADLLGRLAFDVVQLPSLHEHGSGIMPMAEHFTAQMCREIKLPLFPGFTEHTRGTSLNYHQPGNTHELRKVVERSVYRHGASDYPLDDIAIDSFKRRPFEEAIAVSENTSFPTLPLDLRGFQIQQEKGLLQLSLQQRKYNQKRATELLGSAYHQFRTLLKRYQTQRSWTIRPAGCSVNALSDIHNQYIICRPDRHCALGITALTLLLRTNLSAHPTKFLLPH